MQGLGVSVNLFIYKVHLLYYLAKARREIEDFDE